MDLEALKKENFKVVKQKGFVTKASPEVLAERVALIHSEISEMYDAYRQENFTERHGVYEELADVILRTLHLAGIFKIKLGASVRAKKSKEPIENQILKLHSALSSAYENFRHQRIKEFKSGITDVMQLAVNFSANFNFSLMQTVKAKMEMNRNRVWNKQRMNEQFGSK